MVHILELFLSLGVIPLLNLSMYGRSFCLVVQMPLFSVYVLDLV